MGTERGVGLAKTQLRARKQKTAEQLTDEGMDAIQSNFNDFGMFALACQLKVWKVAIRVFLVDFFIRISHRALFRHVLCELKSRRGERGVSDDNLVHVDHSSLLMAFSNLVFKSFSFRGNSLLIFSRTLKTKASIPNRTLYLNPNALPESGF